MEKNMKRALRRIQKEVKFKKRLRVWTPNRRSGVYYGSEGWCDFDEFIKEVKDGKIWTFLRTTSSPCNCKICTGVHKYRATRTKSEREAMKEVWKEIEELNN